MIGDCSRNRLTDRVELDYAISDADDLARALARCGPSTPDIRVLGPAPAPLSLLRGRHRRRLLLKTSRDVAIQPVLRAWLGQIKIPSQARIRVDVDP